MHARLDTRARTHACTCIHTRTCTLSIALIHRPHTRSQPCTCTHDTHDTPAAQLPQPLQRSDRWRIAFESCICLCRVCHAASQHTMLHRCIVICCIATCNAALQQARDRLTQSLAEKVAAVPTAALVPVSVAAEQSDAAADRRFAQPGSGATAV